MTGLKVAIGAGVLAMAGLVAAPVAAQMADGIADKHQGRAVADRLCSNCHRVAPDAERKDTHVAPDFEKIAAKVGQTRERIAGAIIFPHPEMPSIPLTRAEIRDVATYILSLNGESTP